MAFKCERANRILEGEERYSLKQWREDLRQELNCEGEDERVQEAHFMVCAAILYIGTCLIDYPEVKRAFLNIFPGFNKDKEGKKLAGELIKDIRKDYRYFEEILVALLMRKHLDFIERGLSEEAAANLAGKWLQEEVGV
jgi:hypothetical protein